MIQLTFTLTLLGKISNYFEYSEELKYLLSKFYKTQTVVPIGEPEDEMN